VASRIVGFSYMADDKAEPRSGDDAIPPVGLVQEKLIGRVVVQWSKVEAGLNELIWRMLQLTIEDGRILTSRMDAQTKIAMLRKLGPRYLDGGPLEDLQKALKLADNVRDDRNFIVHGTWGTLLPEGEPIALSIRAKAEPGEIRSELFPYSRMRIIIRDILLVKKSLIAAVNAFPPLKEK
jgi:hypothetical protein